LASNIYLPDAPNKANYQNVDVISVKEEPTKHEKLGEVNLAIKDSHVLILHKMAVHAEAEQ